MLFYVVLRFAEKQDYRDADLVDRDVYKLIELGAQPDGGYLRSPVESQLKCDCSATDSQRSMGHRLKGHGGGVYWDYISLCNSDVNGRWNSGEVACHSLGAKDPGKVWCGCDAGERPEIVYCERTSPQVMQRCTCSSGKCVHQRMTEDESLKAEMSSAYDRRRSRAQPTVAEMAVLKMQVDEDEEEERKVNARAQQVLSR